MMCLTVGCRRVRTELALDSHGLRFHKKLYAAAQASCVKSQMFSMYLLCLIIVVGH